MKKKPKHKQTNKPKNPSKQTNNLIPSSCFLFHRRTQRSNSVLWKQSSGHMAFYSFPNNIQLCATELFRRNQNMMGPCSASHDVGGEWRIREPWRPASEHCHWSCLGTVKLRKIKCQTPAHLLWFAGNFGSEVTWVLFTGLLLLWTLHGESVRVLRRGEPLKGGTCGR